MSIQRRTPAGSPEGGEFAAVAGVESTTVLYPALSAKATETIALLTSLSPTDLAAVLESQEGRFTRARDGHMAGVVSTRNMDLDALDDVRVEQLPAGLEGVPVTVHFDYSDNGSPSLTVNLANGDEVSICRGDELHGDRFFAEVYCHRASADATCSIDGDYVETEDPTADGRAGWASNDDDRAQFMRWARYTLQRAELAESAVRYAAIGTMRDGIEHFAVSLTTGGNE